MIFEIRFYTEQGRGNIDRARQILMREYGLVPPRGHLQTAEDVVVWEDEKRIGRYRVHFSPDLRGEEGIGFHYWLNRSRMNKEIFQRDPMRDAVVAVRRSLVGNFTERVRIEDSIDGIFRE